MIPKDPNGNSYPNRSFNHTHKPGYMFPHLSGINNPELINNHNIQISLEFTKNLPKIDKNKRVTLWTESVLGRGPSIRFYLMIQVLFFILSNIAVNSYSLDENLHDYLSEEAVWPLIFIFAICTFISNVFSKVIEVPCAADALNLDSNYPGFVTFFFKYGVQRKFYENFKRALQIATIFNGKKTVYIDSEIKDRVNNAGKKKYDEIIELTRSEFGNEKNYQLKIISEPSELNNIPLNECYTLLACGLSANHEIRNKIRVIDFYPCGFLSRIATECRQLHFASALWTSFKATLAGIRWLITKGVPSFVVILTITHALSNVERVHQSNSRIIRGVAFVTNFMIAYMKMLVNYYLKGNEFDREFIKLIHRITHFFPLLHKKYNHNETTAKHKKTHWNVLIFTILVTIFTFLPSFIVTHLFYTAKGMVTILKEINFVTGASLELPQALATTLTSLVVASSIGIAFSTGSYPLYRKFCELSDKRKHKKNHSVESIMTKQQYGTNNYSIESAQQNRINVSEAVIEQHFRIYLLFRLSTLGDSLVFANNAFFNFAGSWNIVMTIWAAFSHFSHENPWVKPASSLWVAGGILIYAMLWGLYKGKEKFPNCIHLWGELNPWKKQSDIETENNNVDDEKEPLLRRPLAQPIIEEEDDTTTKKHCPRFCC